MAKVSVLVPVYNVEKYLSRCLDSIINQTFQDIEIICINDGSTDDSAKILDAYQKLDSRIERRFESFLFRVVYNSSIF